MAKHLICNEKQTLCKLVSFYSPWHFSFVFQGKVLLPSPRTSTVGVFADLRAVRCTSVATWGISRHGAAEMEEQAAAPSQIGGREGRGRRLKLRWGWSHWPNKWRPSMLFRPFFEDQS